MSLYPSKTKQPCMSLSMRNKNMSSWYRIYMCHPYVVGPNQQSTLVFMLLIIHTIKSILLDIIYCNQYYSRRYISQTAYILSENKLHQTIYLLSWSLKVLRDLFIYYNSLFRLFRILVFKYKTEILLVIPIDAIYCIFVYLTWKMNDLIVPEVA